LVTVVLAVGFLLSACGDLAAGRAPDKDGFHFPVGLAVHPHAGFALVVNSNFNLSRQAGTLQVVDLNKLAARVLGEPVGEVDEYNRDLIQGDRGIGLGDFGAGIALHATPEGGLAAVAVRGRNELVLVDLAVGVDGNNNNTLDLLCWSRRDRPAGSFPSCDGSGNVVAFSRDDPFDVLFVEDPDGGTTAYVTFLRDGSISAVQIPARSVTGDPPRVEYVDIPRVAYTLNTGALGTNDLARSPVTGHVYATSRVAEVSFNPIHYFDPTMAEDAPVYNLDLFHTVLGSETRGVDFAADGLTVGVIVRNPDMLVFLDTTPGENGLPQNSYLGQVVLGNNPSRVRTHGDFMFATCAQDDAVYVADTRTRRLVDIREDICRGPFDIDFYDLAEDDLHWALISCFEEDVVAVVDVDPESTDFMEVVARIGKPRDD
jgi:DNA-binding beta-propeller fold protein YncE